mmetsp:Transcript_19286/g.56278  ORF Transcript_19286/g.56278 Transcript_19286/m.56278 type:complete len:105 (-) Transcript_19286:1082-1396(-)
MSNPGEEMGGKRGGLACPCPDGFFPRFGPFPLPPDECEREANVDAGGRDDGPDDEEAAGAPVVDVRGGAGGGADFIDMGRDRALAFALALILAKGRGEVLPFRA